ncbi:hypothetical protein BDY24DRAFT_412558 [Mrakia frigida]|uniref:uncharacterized protein n=1 Tax=Mrakia frigida TaxID=29902 RepID=UPI003FCC07EB
MSAPRSFNVVVVSRRAHLELAGVERLAHVVANLDDPSNVDNVFQEVIEKLGSVSTLPTPSSTSPSPFSVPVAQLAIAQNTGLLSAYRAAQLLLDSTFDGPKPFLYIGNILHLHGHAWPNGFVLGLSKASAAHFVEVGAKPYGKEGKAFFYNVWESTIDRSVTGNEVDSQGNADIAFQLAQMETQDA